MIVAFINCFILAYKTSVEYGSYEKDSGEYRGMDGSVMKKLPSAAYP